MFRLLQDLRTYSFCGTIEYMAPEVVRGGSHGHDFAVDWWSVGVLTYELLTGASPFTVEGEKNTQAEISKRILRSHPPIPDYMSSSVQDFIKRLLVKDARKRLGGGIEDANELKKHPFFRGLDWADLSQKKVPAPFVPKITGELDVSNFAEEFTSMVPADSPAIVPCSEDKMFKGYSYVAPSVLFSDNVIAEELLEEPNNNNQSLADPSLALPLHQPGMIAMNTTQKQTDQSHRTQVPKSEQCPKKVGDEERAPPRPDNSQLLAAKFGKSPFFESYDLKLNERLLGDGSFSVCRRCVHKKSGINYAVKIVSRRVDTSREVHMLRQCQGNPNIVNLVEVFQDELHTYIVFELLKGGELLDKIRQKTRFTEAEAGRIFKGLVTAVQFMHSQGIVHRDLKPEVSSIVMHPFSCWMLMFLSLSRSLFI